MPKTIEQLNVNHAARVVTAHGRKPKSHDCWCGAEWNPLHVAKELAKAGLIR